MNPGHIGAQGPVCSRPQRADILWGGPNHKICSHTQGPLSPSRLQVRPGSEESGARAPSAADVRPTPTLHHCPGALSEARPRPLPRAAKQTPTSGALSRRDVGGFVLRPPSPPGLDVRPLRETMSRKAPHFSLVTFPFLLWPPGDSALHNSVVTLLAFPPPQSCAWGWLCCSPSHSPTFLGCVCVSGKPPETWGGEGKVDLAFVSLESRAVELQPPVQLLSTRASSSGGGRTWGSRSKRDGVRGKAWGLLGSLLVRVLGVERWSMQAGAGSGAPAPAGGGGLRGEAVREEQDEGPSARRRWPGLSTGGLCSSQGP